MIMPPRGGYRTLRIVCSIVGVVSMTALADTSRVAAQTAASATKPIRTMVYAFRFGTSTDVTVHDSGLDGGPVSGLADYRYAGGDEGTITADVVAILKDGGLAIRISEQAKNSRSAPPAVCVTYGSTMVLCDPHAKVNVEEYALLRFLGRNFVDPALIDSNGTWTRETTGPQQSDVTHFHLDANQDGVLHISEQRKLAITGTGAMTLATQGMIVYDLHRTIPISIDEQTDTHPESGTNQERSIRTQIDLTLKNDSFAGVQAPTHL